jgi:hypothetical protein
LRYSIEYSIVAPGWKEPLWFARADCLFFIPGPQNQQSQISTKKSEIRQMDVYFLLLIFDSTGNEDGQFYHTPPEKSVGSEQCSGRKTLYIFTFVLKSKGILDHTFFQHLQRC